MTSYLDKFKQDHPDERISRYSGVPTECPHHYGYPVKECKRDQYNPLLGPPGTPCWDCWHSEFPEPEAEPIETLTVKQVKIFPGLDEDTYDSLEAKINEFLKTIPTENVVDIRTTETDGKFTVTVVYETEVAK